MTVFWPETLNFVITFERAMLHKVAKNLIVVVPLYGVLGPCRVSNLV